MIRVVEVGLSNNDVAASGARRMPDSRLRDHDSNMKLNVEGAFGGGRCMASRDGPWPYAGKIVMRVCKGRKGERGWRLVEGGNSSSDYDGGGGRLWWWWLWMR